MVSQVPGLELLKGLFPSKFEQRKLTISSAKLESNEITIRISDAFKALI